MGEATVNGDMPHSSFISHLTSYPLISDSITTFKNNPYGAKSIDLTNSGYAKFVKPAFPYLETPVAYAKPYIAKADQIGDSLLSKVDEKIPIVKSETAELKGTFFDYAQWPLVKAGEGKDWIFTTYGEEYKKCGGNGYVAGGKAVITSSLVITSDVLNWLSSFVAAKKAEAKEAAKEKTGK
jgi:hypothetical protein